MLLSTPTISVSGNVFVQQDVSASIGGSNAVRDQLVAAHQSPNGGYAATRLCSDDHHNPGDRRSHEGV